MPSFELIKPTEISVEEESYTSTFGKFSVQPLERGYGVTLGNALRRVLLSSIPGAALTRVEIAGVSHEFTSIPDVREDVVEIILNLKGVRFRMEGDGVQEVLLEKQGPGEVTAGDFQIPPALQIMNPSHYIATLGEKGKIRIRGWVEKGRGFRTAEENKTSEAPLGSIFMDSLFSPVRKVNFEVRNARVGKRTDYERLILEISTDGSVTPKEALVYAARILQDQLQIFFFTGTEDAKVATGFGMDPRLLSSLAELDLSNRVVVALESYGVLYLGDLVQLTREKLKEMKNIGEQGIREIENFLSGMGFSLGMTLKEWERIRPRPLI